MHITTRTLLAAPPVLLEPVMMNLSDNGTRSHDTETDEQFQKFNPSTAIIIIVFVASFFFMGIFSLYISKCREDSSAARRRQILLGNGTVQYEATHRGLDLEVIESFPVFTYDLVKGLKTQMKEITECAVCLNNFEEDEQLRLLPKCGHAFHPECIDMWLSSHTTCPLCRTSLVPEDMSNPSGTEFGVIEPVIEPAEDAPEISIPIASTSRRTVGFSLPASREGSVRPSRHGSRRGDVKGPGPAQNVAGKAAEELEAPGDSDLSRSYSTGHSLVRLRKNMGGEKSTEWFISTPIGLTPASHKTCTYAVNQGLAMHSKSQGFNIGGSKFSRFPLFSKQFSFGRGRQQQQDNQEQNSGSIRRWYERRFRSEKNSTEMDPALFRRSFSERTGPVFKPEGYNPQTQIARVEKEDDARAYILNLKRTLKRFTGLEDESASSSNVVGASPVIAGGSVSERGIVKVAADL